MDAVVELARVINIQVCLKVIAGLLLTSYLFPKQAIVTDTQKFDFIVVGGGSSGAVVAARLAEAQFYVLLVEAGGDPPLESVTPSLMGYLTQTQYDWNHTNQDEGHCSECYRNNTLNLPSGCMLGGSSSMNYMVYVRGCPGDFTPWVTAVNDNTWNWENILQYYIKSEKLLDEEILHSPQAKYHGTVGFLGVAREPNVLAEKYMESFRELGHELLLDINADSHLGYNQPLYTIADGVRQSTAYTILGEQKYNPYLQVLKKTVVTKILFDKYNNAVGIRAARHDDKEIELVATKEVIVSAGALNTPRLLMLSGIGPEQHLQSLNIPIINNLPVGENLQDHAMILTAIKVEKSTESPDVPDPRKHPWNMFIGYVALNKTKMCPDYQSIIAIIPNDARSILGICTLNFGYDYDICQNLYEALKGRRMLMPLHVLLHPESRGRVLLRSSNPIDPPLVDMRYLSDKRDLETIVDSLIDFFEILNTSYFKSINAEIVDLKLDMCKGLKYRSREWWRCYVKCMISTVYHYAGTCALGSVVDSHLRVFGVGRLRVADNSIMPELISGNTNAAAIMIGEKAAEFIKEDHICAFNP